MEAEGTEAELLSVDLLDVAPTFHIARHLPAVLHSRAPFMFVMQVGFLTKMCFSFSKQVSAKLPHRAPPAGGPALARAFHVLLAVD